MLRVIAGKYGGRSLQAPPTRLTRPVTDKVRAAIFSSLGQRVIGAEVLDLYAGSGALGIEALSRGALSLDLVENSHPALKSIETNLKNLITDSRVQLNSDTVESFLTNTNKYYDLIFFDPPYQKFDPGLAQRANDLLKSDGVLVVSCSSKIDYRPTGLINQRAYGDTMITYLKK